MAMLKPGDMAPEFEPEADDGSIRSLDSLLGEGKPLILYFYPADFTPVCTAEACAIRDMHDDIEAADYQVVGVSPQGRSSHERFKQRHDLPFPLLFDAGKKVIRAFGVDGFMGLGVRRATFVIDPDRSIRARVVADLSAKSHAEFIRQAIVAAG